MLDNLTPDSEESANPLAEAIAFLMLDYMRKEPFECSISNPKQAAKDVELHLAEMLTKATEQHSLALILVVRNILNMNLPVFKTFADMYRRDMISMYEELLRKTKED